MSERAALPDAAKIVVVGAGALGCSIAMQLTALGERDVLVLDKSGVTHGSTWHAAGLVGQYRTAWDLTRLMQSSVALMSAIEAETPIDWRPVGSLRLASSPARWRELQAGAEIARRHGVEMSLLTPAEAKERLPLLALDGVLGAAHVAGDGHVDPASLALAYAARARAGGARIREGVTVTGFERRGSRVTKVITDKGGIACETLVLAPGVWARALGRKLDLDLPVAAISHQYAVTETRADVPRDLPALRDPDLGLYVKAERGGFAIGGWERDSRPAHAGETPTAFGRELLADDLDRLLPILAAAMRRLPVTRELGVKTIINGPIPVTPDGEPMLGPAPGRPGIFLAVGFTSGIAASGGAGRALAEWIVAGEPEFALPSLDPARFGPAPIGLNDLNRRACAAYSAYYALSGAAIAE